MESLSEIARNALSFLMGTPAWLIFAVVGLFGLWGVIHASREGDGNKLGLTIILMLIALSLVYFLFMHN